MLNTLIHNKYILILLGGGLGSLLRYLVQGWSQRITFGVFPIGTLIVNVVGCFAIGLLATAPFARPEYRTGLVIGLLGGFTTYSAFGWETFSLANDRQTLAAFANILLSVALGLAAVWFGYRLSERVFGV